ACKAMKSFQAKGTSRLEDLAMSESAGRHSVPRDVAREVLVAAGHRCAVCGSPCPLERAHIVPWCRKRSNTEEDLICLCSNCHQRADSEKWGEKTLRRYKMKPW